MAVFKIEKCTSCAYKHHEPNPKINKNCPKCGAVMKYLPNWYISYQINGRKYVEVVGPQKRFAEDALAKRKIQIREGKFFDTVREITWEEAVSTLRKTYIALSRETQRMYENSIGILEEHGFGKHSLNKLTPELIHAYIEERLQQGITNSTVNRELATLKRMAKLCKCHQLFNEIQLLPENAPRKRFLSDEEKERLKKAISESNSSYLQLAILITLDTGLRQKEVLSLRWDEIDFATGFITKKVKGGKILKIPMTERLRKILIGLKEKLTDQKIISMHIFHNPATGTYTKNLRASFVTALKKAKIKDCRWHDLRRTFASHFVMATRDLVALQQLLGHSDYNTTKKHYAHLVDEHLKNAISTYEAQK